MQKIPKMQVDVFYSKKPLLISTQEHNFMFKQSRPKILSYKLNFSFVCKTGKQISRGIVVLFQIVYKTES
jgi:hypothetical protein